MTNTHRIPNAQDDLVRSRFSSALALLDRVRAFRPVARRLTLLLERGELRSATIRRILRERFGVSVGAYSYGQCLVPGAFPAGVSIGRYVSIGPGVRVFRRNHPLDRLSTHPYFYYSMLGVVERDTIESADLWIGHDAWIGADSIITPGCTRIGIGAVIGAGALVTKDVPDFAIVGGNPASLIRMRFDAKTIERALATRWWERPVEELQEFIPLLTRELDNETLRSFGISIDEEAARCA